MGHSRPLFFSIVILSKQRVLAFCTKDILLVVSFEQQISDGGSNHSTNCATTSGLKNFMTKSFFVTTFNAAGRSFISTNEQKLLLPCLFLIPVDCIGREKQHFLRATKIAEIKFLCWACLLAFAEGALKKKESKRFFSTNKLESQSCGLNGKDLNSVISYNSASKQWWWLNR